MEGTRMRCSKLGTSVYHHFDSCNETRRRVLLESKDVFMRYATRVGAPSFGKGSSKGISCVCRSGKDIHGKRSASKGFGFEGEETVKARLQEALDNRREKPEEELWIPRNYDWMEPCPCGGGESERATYRQCCEPLHKFNRLAPNPATLARARYSAYVKGDVDFLVMTIHPMNPDLKDDKYERELRAICEQVKFTGFLLVGVENITETESYVTFITTFEKYSGPPRVAMQEKSRYTFENDRWWYREASHVEMR